MDHTERLQRYKFNLGYCEDRKNADEVDEETSSRILALLNHQKLDKFCMVDAYYYDYSVLPFNLQDKFYRDMYLLFGITIDGEIVSKWVERYDLDSSYTIIDGEVKK